MVVTAAVQAVVVTAAVHVQAQLQGVDTIYSTDRAFVAQLADGRVVTWGWASWGGDSTARCAGCGCSTSASVAQ